MLMIKGYLFCNYRISKNIISVPGKEHPNSSFYLTTVLLVSPL